MSCRIFFTDLGQTQARDSGILKSVIDIARSIVALNFQTRERAKRKYSSLDQVDTKMISEVFINGDAKWCLTV